MGGFDAPVFVAGRARQEEAAVRGRAGGHDRGRAQRQEAGQAVPRHPRPRPGLLRGGPALDGLRPGLRQEPALLRLLREPRRRHPGRRLQAQARLADPSQRALAPDRDRDPAPVATRTTTEASFSSATTACSTSAPATAGPPEIRPTTPRTPRACSASCCGSTRGASRAMTRRESNPFVGAAGRRRGLLARAAQPVSLLLRQPDGQPRDRRRRAERLGGDRLHERRRRPRCELRLGQPRGQPLLRGPRHRARQLPAADPRVLERLLGDRRLRGPRPRVAVARGTAALRRPRRQRDPLAGPLRGELRAPPTRAPGWRSHSHRRSARARAARSTSPRSRTTPCTGSSSDERRRPRWDGRASRVESASDQLPSEEDESRWSPRRSPRPPAKRPTAPPTASPRRPRASTSTARSTAR